MKRRHFLASAIAAVLAPADLVMTPMPSILGSIEDGRLYAAAVPDEFLEFQRSMLRQIAASMGIPYDELISDYSRPSEVKS